MKQILVATAIFGSCLITSLRVRAETCNSDLCTDQSSLCSPKQTALAFAYRASAPMVPLTTSVTSLDDSSNEIFEITFSGSAVQKIFRITVQKNDCSVLAFQAD